MTAAGGAGPAFAYILNGAVKNADMQTIWTAPRTQPARKSIFGFLKGNLLHRRWGRRAARSPGSGEEMSVSGPSVCPLGFPSYGEAGAVKGALCILLYALCREALPL